jgi:hypothetical protein
MPDKEQVAAELIKTHFTVEPHLSEVWRIVGDNEASPTEPIKLLEVNDATVATASIVPFCFTPTKDVPFPTVIIEMTSEEFAAVTKDPSRLPNGWSLRNGHAHRFPRPE